MNNVNNTLDILNTIYSKVKQMADGVYAISDNDKFGLALTELGVIVEPKYRYAVYRKYYAAFSLYNPKTASIQVMDNNSINTNSDKHLLVFYSKPSEIITLDNISNICEHSGVEYKLLERVKDANTSYLYDTVTGKVICEYNHTKDYRFRGQENNIIFAYDYYKDNSSKPEVYGVDKEFRAGRIEDLLHNYYKEVQIDTRYKKFKVTDNDGKEITLNRFGQFY